MRQNENVKISNKDCPKCTFWFVQILKWLGDIKKAYSINI